MSVYKKIEVEFSNTESLKKALQDAGLSFQICENGKANGYLLQGYHTGDDKMVAIGVTRESLARATGRNLYTGAGFVWNGKGYDMVVDHLDVNKPEHKAIMARIKQRYAYHEVVRNARAKGYTVRQVSTGGTIRLQLTKG